MYHTYVFNSDFLFFFIHEQVNHRAGYLILSETRIACIVPPDGLDESDP